MLRKIGLIVVAAAMMLGVSTAVSTTSAVAAPSFSPQTLAGETGYIGSAYFAQLLYDAGSTWTLTSGQLPPGLSLNAAGQIAGVPTQGGAYTFVVQASSLSGPAKKAYTILVNMPTSTGYDSRQHSVIVARDASPSPSACNHTGYATYAIADLWINRDPVDVNNKLASLQFSHYGGDPSACSSHSDQRRNNLMLSFLVRAYMLYYSGSSYFPGRLTPAAQSNLVAQMWSYARTYSKLSEAGNSWSIYDSENHDAQAEGFYFMAAQIFKNTPGYANKVYADGSTVAQQYKAWDAHWSSYFDERAKRGLFIEEGSPTYHGYVLDAILNIYNFANDPVLREKADMLLDLDFADYAQQQLDSIWGGPKSRSYPTDSYNGANDSMTSLGNLLFGRATTIGGDNHVLMLATSGYSPPPVVESMGTNHAGLGSFEYITRRPGGGPVSPTPNDDWLVNPDQSVLNYAFVTPDYVMGTTELKPGEKHIAPSSQNRWEGITFNAGGGARIYPQAAPSNFSPTNDAFLSVQKENVLITEKQNYTDKSTLVYFGNTLTQVVAKGGWLFAQQGPSYVAVRPAIGSYHWLTSAKNRAHSPSDRFIQLTDKVSPIIFEAGRSAGYSSFAAFEQHILGNKITHTSNAVTYTSKGTKFTMFSDTGKAPLINNERITYTPPLVFNSPYMRSAFGSGKITIKFGSQSATYDFSKTNTPGKTVH